MFGYSSEEIKKFKANTKELDKNKLRNKEIIGLFLLGELSYQDLKEWLGLTEEEGRELIEGLAFQLSRNVLREDEHLQVNIWSRDEQKK